MVPHALAGCAEIVEACAIAVSNSCDKVSSDRNKREEMSRSGSRHAAG